MIKSFVKIKRNFLAETKYSFISLCNTIQAHKFQKYFIGMITTTKKNDKRSERLEPELMGWLKETLETSTMSALAEKLKVERTSLHNTIARGSGHPSTVKKIRRSFQKAVAFLSLIFLLSGCYCAKPVAVLTASEMKAKIEADSTLVFYQMKGWDKRKVANVKHIQNNP